MKRTYKAVTMDGQEILLETEEEYSYCVAVKIGSTGWEPFAWTNSAVDAREELAKAQDSRGLVEVISVTEVAS